MFGDKYTGSFVLQLTHCLLSFQSQNVFLIYLICLYNMSIYSQTGIAIFLQYIYTIL